MPSSIKRIATEEPTLFAFEVDGRIRSADLHAMAETVETGFDTFETIDMLILITRYDGIEFRAVIDPAQLGAQLRANRNVRRYAVVGAPSWAEALINIGDRFTPVEARTFNLSDTKAAWDWVVRQ